MPPTAIIKDHIGSSYLLPRVSLHFPGTLLYRRQLLIDTPSSNGHLDDVLISEELGTLLESSCYKLGEVERE